MKKVIICVLLLMLVASCALADNMMVHITAVCYDVNHVGFDWAGYFQIGDMEIHDGDVIDLYPGKYSLYTVIGEYDSTPDLGTYEELYNVTDSRLLKGFTAQHTVDVMEDKGGYAGCWCEWYVNYEFIPVGDAYYLSW